METKKIVLALLLLIITSCKDTNTNKIENSNMEDKDNFSWSATITNPDGYYVEIHEGYIADDKQMIAPFVNLGTITQSWGYDGSGISGGNKIPTHFSLTWLGYADKKFWKVEGKLPSDTLLNLFKTGYLHTDELDVRSKITYKHITFGLAPGGMVVVWLSGRDERVEIGVYQAEETFVDNNKFWRNPENMNQKQFLDLYYSYISPETKAEIKAHGLPVGKWEKYRKKYNYCFKSQIYKPTVTEEFYRRLKYYNGEEEILKEGELDLYRKKAIPYKVSFYYKDNGIKGGQIIFNDQEMMRVFETLSKKYPNEPIDIIAKVGFEYRSMTFTVVCGKESIKLEKVELTNMSGVAK
jgi:hypothetical protein